MGKLDFKIFLNKQNTIYTSGETIDGYLKFRTKSRLKINSIRILAEGHAKVKWSENTSDQSLVRYTEHEQYLNLSQILVSKQDQNYLNIEKGVHSYYFQIILPENLPSSFEHRIANIRYSIKGIIDVPWRKNKHTIKQFTIINSVDLNKLSPSLRQPMEVNDSKKVFLSIGGNIYATFRVEKCGFVPGETIHFTAKINNTCNRKVTRTRVKLVQEIKFVGSYNLFTKISNTKYEYRDIANLEIDNEIEGHTSQEVYSNESIVIPSVGPSLIGMNKIIQVNYFLVFTFGVRGSMDKNLMLPITIGTIPFLCINQESINHDYVDSPSYDSLPSYEKLFVNQQDEK